MLLDSHPRRKKKQACCLPGMNVHAVTNAILQTIREDISYALFAEIVKMATVTALTLDPPNRWLFVGAILDQSLIHATEVIVRCGRETVRHFLDAVILPRLREPDPDIAFSGDWECRSLRLERELCVTQWVRVFTQLQPAEMAEHMDIVGHILRRKGGGDECYFAREDVLDAVARMEPRAVAHVAADVAGVLLDPWYEHTPCVAARTAYSSVRALAMLEPAVVRRHARAVLIALKWLPAVERAAHLDLFQVLFPALTVVDLTNFKAALPMRRSDCSTEPRALELRARTNLRIWRALFRAQRALWYLWSKVHAPGRSAHLNGISAVERLLL